MNWPWVALAAVLPGITVAKSRAFEGSVPGRPPVAIALAALAALNVAGIRTHSAVGTGLTTLGYSILFCGAAVVLARHHAFRSYVWMVVAGVTAAMLVARLAE